MTHLQNIDSTMISLGEPERKKAGSFHYTSVPILCEGKPLIIRASGRFRIYENGKDIFSIGLCVNDTNRKALEDIEDKIRKETRTLRSVPGFKQEEFQLIKVNKFGDFAKVYSKLYTTKDGRITARFYEKVMHESGAKKILIPDQKSMVSVPFDGEIILQIQRLHFGSVRSITIVAKEVLVKEVINPESFFDDLDDYMIPNVCIDEGFGTAT